LLLFEFEVEETAEEMKQRESKRESAHRIESKRMRGIDNLKGLGRKESGWGVDEERRIKVWWKEIGPC